MWQGRDKEVSEEPVTTGSSRRGAHARVRPSLPTGSRGGTGVAAAACLDTGLLAGRKHELIGLQRLSLPDSVREIDEPAGLPRAGGIPRKQPAAVLPGADGVFVEPAPEGAARQAGHQAGPAGMATQFSAAPTRQGTVPPRGQFTGRGLDLDDHLRGGGPRPAGAWTLLDTFEARRSDSRASAGESAIS